MKKRYLIEVEGGIHPVLHGPFDAQVEQNRAARALRNQDEDTVVFWLEIEGADPEIGAYSAQFMEVDK